MNYAERVIGLQAEGAYQVLARAKELEAQGHRIIHLEVGEPDFATPEHIRQAGVQAIHDGYTRYTSPRGIPELRKAIAAQASRRRGGFPIQAEQVLVAPGAKPLLFFPTLAVVNPGDEVIYPDPGFPTYKDMIAAAGGVPVPVPLTEENQFSFDLEAFDRLVGPQTRLIVLNTPGSNPTGSVIPLADLEHIAAAAREYDCWVLVDEIYERIVYDNLQVPSMLTLPGMAERTILVDGFSKSYAMTGWRLGYGILPVGLAERVELLLTHSFGSTAEFTQLAGVAALEGDQSATEAMVKAYQTRRDRIVAGLNSIPGLHCQVPQAAFYAFPNIKSTGIQASELARRILDEAGVALLPGSSFGKYGEGYLRLSYANSLENIDKALERLDDFFSNLA